MICRGQSGGDDDPKGQSQRYFHERGVDVGY